MILLNGHSLEPARRVPLSAMSLQLSERESTATMTPEDMDGITIGSWLRDDTEPGKDIVWRVKSISRNPATKQAKVSLEHAVSLLKDRILFGEIKPATITGDAKATGCTARQAISYILGKQSDWVLGECEFTDSNPYKFDGDNLFDALEQVSDTLADCRWEYDMTMYPFRISFRKKSGEIGTVMRPARNISAMTKTVDRGGMYTRFYPIGKNDLELPEQFIEKNTDLYGVISKVETDESIETAEGLRKWARERLKKHAEPQVTIDVDGLELADATGESLDRMRLGRKCRIPLSEYGSEITEEITGLNYPDKVRQPESVKVTLANNRKDITKILADAMKKGGRGGRGAAKQQKEDLAWFEDTNEHVAMCAKGIVGVDAKGNPNWIRLTRLVADGNGLDSSVQSVQNGLVIAESRITQTENRISAEVRARSEQGEQLESRIDMTEKELTLTVKKDSVISAIRMSPEEVKIQARRVNLEGYVTVSELNATKAQISNLESGVTQASYLRAATLKAGSMIFGTAVLRRGYLTVDGTTFKVVMWDG